jgi:L-cysteine S-thiosulfotransferase
MRQRHNKAPSAKQTYGPSPSRGELGGDGVCVAGEGRGKGYSAFALIISLALVTQSALAAGTNDTAVKNAEEIVRKAFVDATPDEWKARLAQDQMQAACSYYHNEPPPDMAVRIVSEAQASIRYPADGKLLGDWKQGAKLAAISTGGHIGKIQPDPPGKPRGGNCYACHALTPQEVAAGNIGPGLTNYLKLRGNSPGTVKSVYDKIYNAQAQYACSLMPRFGHNGWLTPEQIADIVAFLLDAESPVNKGGD